MAATLIIGYGNPLRGDDGIGWQAARQLAAILQKPDLEIMTCHQLTLELAEGVSRARLVLFVDAEQSHPPGKLSCRVIKPEGALPGAFSHHLKPENLLAWAEKLYGRSPDALMFSVAGQSFAPGEELSAPVAAVLPELIERICNMVVSGKTASVFPK
jgi:hydrogenase maturation protease